MLSIRELKTLCARHGVDTSSALERSDLVALAEPFLTEPADTVPSSSGLPASAAPAAHADGSMQTLRRPSLNERLRELIRTQRPLGCTRPAATSGSVTVVPALPGFASTTTSAEPTQTTPLKRKLSTPRRIRICSSNVPPALATNKVENGEQVLSGVQEDRSGEQWKARIETMAEQWRAVEAAVVLHQELHSDKLEELLRAANCGLRPVECRWCCPISYDANVVQPLYADRFVLGSAPGKFLAEGVCKCKFGQWSYSACHCWPDDGEWRAGGATYAAFRFRDSPPERVDFVCISVHLTDRQPDLRTRGAQEVLVPLVQALRERFNAPVVVGGDFNMTKLQSSDKMNKNGGGAGWRPGAYDALVGSHKPSYEPGERVVAAHEANRELLKRGSVTSFVRQGADPDSDYEEEEDVDKPPPVMADTWELARAQKTSQANGCVASTCHNWFGLYRGFQKKQVYSQGPGSNSIDVYEEGQLVRTVAQKHAHEPVYGSARFIDWLLVDFASLKEGRVEVQRATVHTAPGTNDLKVILKLPGAWGGKNQPDGPTWRQGGGWGSDHFPISVDLQVLPCEG